jgi:hypothetical protein
MAFCPGCGLPREATHPVGPAPVSPWTPPGVPGPVPSLTPPPERGAPPAYYRPPQNPRQTASYAAGVMMLLGGIFAFVFGTVILVMDAFTENWIDVNRSETVLVPEAFVPGLVLVVGFALSMAGAYAAFRLVRYELTMAGPAVLIAGFLIVYIYEPIVMLLLAETLVLATVSLALLLHARPVFARVAHPIAIPETNG